MTSQLKPLTQLSDSLRSFVWIDFSHDSKLIVVNWQSKAVNGSKRSNNALNTTKKITNFLWFLFAFRNKRVKRVTILNVKDLSCLTSDGSLRLVSHRHSMPLWMPPNVQSFVLDIDWVQTIDYFSHIIFILVFFLFTSFLPLPSTLRSVPFAVLPMSANWAQISKASEVCAQTGDVSLCVCLSWDQIKDEWLKRMRKKFSRITYKRIAVTILYQRFSPFLTISSRFVSFHNLFSLSLFCKQFVPYLQRLSRSGLTTRFTASQWLSNENT